MSAIFLLSHKKFLIKKDFTFFFLSRMLMRAEFVRAQVQTRLNVSFQIAWLAAYPLAKIFFLDKDAVWVDNKDSPTSVAVSLKRVWVAPFCDCKAFKCMNGAITSASGIPAVRVKCAADMLICYRWNVDIWKISRAASLCVFFRRMYVTSFTTRYCNLLVNWMCARTSR